MIIQAGVCGLRPVYETAKCSKGTQLQSNIRVSLKSTEVWATSLLLPGRQVDLKALMGLHSVCFCLLISAMLEHPAQTNTSPGRYQPHKDSQSQNYLKLRMVKRKRDV